MARPPQEQLTPKQQVLRDLEEARASLAWHATLAAEEWSPRAIVTRSMTKHRTLWIAGAAVAGLVLVKSLWPSGGGAHQPRESFLGGSSKSRGMLALLLSPLVTFGRKAALNYGAQLFQSYLRQKVSPNDPDGETV